MLSRSNGLCLLLPLLMFLEILAQILGGGTPPISICVYQLLAPANTLLYTPLDEIIILTVTVAISDYMQGGGAWQKLCWAVQ